MNDYFNNAVKWVLLMKLVSVLMHGVHNLPVEQKSGMQCTREFYADFPI